MLTNLKQTKIVIVGFGKFGSLLYKILVREGLDLVVVEKNRIADPSIKQLTLEAAIPHTGLIISCVPISEFRNTITKVSGLLSNTVKNQPVVIDVCSVKLRPSETMLELLPANVGIVATHPLWGPVSSEDGEALVGLKFLYKIIRNNGNPIINEFIQLWSSLGQELVEISPEEHDRQAAYSQAFAFLVGKIGNDLNIHESHTTTKGLQGILYNQEVVGQESEHLFIDMFRYNPFAGQMLDEFIIKAQEIKQELLINS